MLNHLFLLIESPSHTQVQIHFRGLLWNISNSSPPTLVWTLCFLTFFSYLRILNQLLYTKINFTLWFRHSCSWNAMCHHSGHALHLPQTWCPWQFTMFMYHLRRMVRTHKRLLKNQSSFACSGLLSFVFNKCCGLPSTTSN